MKRAEQAERDAKIVAGYRAGHIQVRLAEQFALTPSAIGMILKRHGLTWRDGGRSKRSAGVSPILEKQAEKPFSQATDLTR